MLLALAIYFSLPAAFFAAGAFQEFMCGDAADFAMETNKTISAFGIVGWPFWVIYWIWG